MTTMNHHGIPSFYEASKVDERYSFSTSDPARLEELRRENIFTDYDSTTHIRIMKHFKSRKSDVCANDMIAKCWRDDNQNEFYVRCYLPKSKISAKSRNERIDKLIIMFNGLDEILNYDLYDALGSQFATNGIASILLPTPYHLNRRCIDQEATDKFGKKRYRIPSHYAVEERAMMYYYNYQKSMHELEDLLQCIIGHDRDDHGFYSSLFNPSALKITLFGFSLGGLRALGSALSLKSTYPQISSCVTWNTGPGLIDANVGRIGANVEHWPKTMERVRIGLNELLAGHDLHNKELARICKWLYFSPKPDSMSPDEVKEFEGFKDLRDKLGRISPSCLSIQSAADSIVAVNSFERILPKPDCIDLLYRESTMYPVMTSNGVTGCPGSPRTLFTSSRVVGKISSIG